MLKNCLLFFTVLLSLSTNAQDDAFVDSLKILIKNAKHDTMLIKQYGQWSHHIHQSDPEKSFELIQLMDSICLVNIRKKELSPTEEKYFKTNWAALQNNMGDHFRKKGELEKALGHFKAGYQVKSELEDKSGMAYLVGNMALVYTNQTNYPMALKCHDEAIRLREEIGDSVSIGSSLNNIGILYYYMGDLSKATTYFRKSAKIAQEQGAKSLEGNALDNVGCMLLELDDIDSAEYYFNKSLAIRQEIDSKFGVCSSIMSLGLIAQKRQEYDKALAYFQESLELANEIGFLSTIISSSINIGSNYALQGDYNSAIKYSLEAKQRAEEVGMIPSAIEAAQTLYESYKLTGDYKKSLENYEFLVSAKDSIKSAENIQLALEQELKHDYDKQHISDSLEFAKQKAIEKIAHDQDLKSEANQRYILYGGIGVLLVIGVLIFRSNQQKKRDNKVIATQRDEVAKQKEIVELTHKEIRDSIEYAKRIQSAILPNQRLIQSVLPESFVYYQPKDVVAGDFYWLEKVGDLTLIACADCTGHGVPGAMVSVVCNNAMNRAVREFKLKSPAEILNKSREIILAEFADSDEEVQDGMDISLCAISENVIEFSGANNPLWILRNGELIEFKGDKQPVGKFDQAKPFTNHVIQTQKGDQLYLFSDGIIDQFGGEKGKKFKANALRQLLKETGLKSMNEQKIIIKKSLNDWMGDLEQVDDICVIGVKV